LGGLFEPRFGAAVLVDDRDGVAVARNDRAVDDALPDRNLSDLGCAPRFDLGIAAQLSRLDHSLPNHSASL
jgi:hypothetical protein